MRYFCTFSKVSCAFVTNRIALFRPSLEMAKIRIWAMLWVEARREQGGMTHYPTTSGSSVVYTFFYRSGGVMTAQL